MTKFCVVASNILSISVTLFSYVQNMCQFTHTEQNALENCEVHR